MENESYFNKDSWMCPKCGYTASKYFCGKCGFKIYAGFVYRFVAAFIDSLIYVPFYIFIKISNDSIIGTQFVSVLLGLSILIFYQVVLVGFLGQTFGKMFARIKIVRLDGSKIQWPNAWLRCSVELFAGISAVFMISLIAYKTSFKQTMDVAYSGLPQFKWIFVLLALLVIGTRIYSWSEVLVLMTNKKRRAIHDFIAETVVIHDPRLTRTPWKSNVEIPKSRLGD